MSESAVVKVNDVSFSYSGQVVLDQVSLDVAPGEFLGLIGPNGGGKTTLLRLLLGLERPSAGSIRVFGVDPVTSHQWRSRVGIVPQNRQLPPRFPARAWDVVELGLMVRGARKLTRAERHARVRDALALTGAAAYSDKPLWQLSGGQKQRVFVARALVLRPELLLLDEPTVGVDAEGQDLMLEWIGRWREERGITVILVSHDIGVIAPLADRIACLNARLFFHDRPDRLTGEALQQAYGCPAEVLFHSSHAVPHRVVGGHDS